MPGFFYRLAPRDQKVYLRSDAIDAFDLAVGPNALSLAEVLVVALEGGSIAGTGRAAQALVTELCRLLGVRVRADRSQRRAPAQCTRRASRHLLSRRAAHRVVDTHGLRHDVVKPKTFLRTLMHELAHYFDYAVFRLGNSYHTRGFFKRESFLVRAVFPPVRHHSLTQVARRTPMGCRDFIRRRRQRTPSFMDLMGILQRMWTRRPPEERLLAELADIAGRHQELADRLARHARLCAYPNIASGLAALAAHQAEHARALHVLLSERNVWSKLPRPMRGRRPEQLGARDRRPGDACSSFARR